MARLKFVDYRDLLRDQANEQDDGMAATSSKRRSIHPLKQDNDERPNFRIIRCCGTCKYSTAAGPNRARMACIYPTRNMAIKKKEMRWAGKITKEMLMMLPPTHALCLCEYYSRSPNLRFITAYCGAEYYGEEFA
jgi:hypothetical protein